MRSPSVPVRMLTICSLSIGFLLLLPRGHPQCIQHIKGLVCMPNHMASLQMTSMILSIVPLLIQEQVNPDGGLANLYVYRWTC
jgi:hypothetical protein